MSILSGIKKVIPYFKNADGNYEQLSYKTSSQTVDFDDGKTAETKLGAINGITKSLNSTSDSVAISASAGKSLQDQITTLNSNITTVLPLYVGHTGNDELTVSNMSSCGTIHVSISLGATVLGHVEIPYSSFKRGITLRCSTYDGSTYYKQDVTYICDTRIKVTCNDNSAHANLSFTVYGTC